MLSSIERLLKALDEHKIIYCHWKSNEHLGEALDGDTDLDVLFDPAQRTELERIFDECGLKRFRATPLMQYNAIEDFIGFDQEAAKIWHVHTHYRMTLGEKHLKGYTITPWGSILLKDRVRIGEVWTSNPADEFVLLLCRIALKLRWRDVGHGLGKDDQAELAWLREQIDKEKVATAAGKMVGERSEQLILGLYETDLKKKSQFVPLQKTLRKELKPYTAYSRAGSWFVRTKREIFWLYGGVKRRLGWSNYSANRRVSPAGGVVVALLGCDGAGKSTTLEYIYNEFRKKLDVVTIYLGSGDGSSSILRAPMKIVALKVGGRGIGKTVEKEYAEKKVSFKARVFSFAKFVWAVTLALEKKGKLRKMVKARNNGLLVLTDRYPQINMPGVGDGPLLDKYRGKSGLVKKIANWEHRIYESFSVNAPDLMIKLMVPTEVAISRKPEMTAEEIDNKKAIVMGINVSEHQVVIDTSRPFEITRGEVMKEIWNLI
ncbi:MAG: hypothetical protein IJI25_04955 [Eubacterium sp.]|nr:hypothetical protein [Eubacterium sp.]